jgi:DNA topoisomerase I
VASQMADAVGQTVSIRLAGRSATDEAVEFTASGRTITFPGFLKAYVESRDEAPATGDDDNGSDDTERRLPRLERGQKLDTQELDAKGHTTSPPARYTEPSLVARLEELGIGRPSTYASIMQTIQDRGYVWKKGNSLVPSFIAFAVVNLLEQHFAQLVDYDFTASLEEELDEIAGGTLQRVDWLTEFYFGGAGRGSGIAESGGLKQIVGQRLEEIDARGVNSIPLRATGPDGTPVVARVGRYGPYLQAGGEDGARVSIPEDLAPDELTNAKVQELLEAPSGDRELGTDPESGHPVVVKAGRYGPYVTTVVPEGSKDAPRTASLFASMSPETLTLDEALKLLTLPRAVGTAPDGEEIQALNGRYGPYIKKGTDSRSLENEEKLFTVTLDEALAIFAQPKQRGRRAAAAPLKELGADPVTQGQVTVREGRFGPYVTDGETNASLRKGDEVETITIERAAELLADRRARGPATKKKAAKKTSAKKATAKKAPARKTAAKKTATPVAAS